MKNTAQQVNNEVAATNDRIFSDEMIVKILNAEAEMEQHPNNWVSLDELKEEMARI